MSKNTNSSKNVDQYIKDCQENVQIILQNIRDIIKKIAPDAVESISYGMPAYKINGQPLVYFAAFPNHIGFYATPVTHEAFADELGKYKTGKGSVQFPLNQSIPYDLISKLTKYKLDKLTSVH